MEVEVEDRQQHKKFVGFCRQHAPIFDIVKNYRPFVRK